MGFTSQEQWSFADGLGFIPMGDPETIVLKILILRQVASNRKIKKKYSQLMII